MSQSGDCKPNDPWANPAATEICGDYVDDDCNNVDVPCPTTNTASIIVPNWDCLASPIPSNVYAYALFSNGAPHFQANACFIFFEGLPNEFYAQRVNLARSNQDAGCNTVSGCTCPTNPTGLTTYDRRLYAVMKSETVSPCAELAITDHAGEMQPVSNDCRKYLYQLHYPSREPPLYSFIDSSAEALERRITLYPTAEVICAANPPNNFLIFSTLMTATIQKNVDFVKQ